MNMVDDRKKAERFLSVVEEYQGNILEISRGEEVIEACTSIATNYPDLVNRCVDSVSYVADSGSKDLTLLASTKNFYDTVKDMPNIDEKTKKYVEAGSKVFAKRLAVAQGNAAQARGVKFSPTKGGRG